jgi:hypothetical protein
MYNKQCKYLSVHIWMISISLFRFSKQNAIYFCIEKWKFDWELRWWRIREIAAESNEALFWKTQSHSFQNLNQAWPLKKWQPVSITPNKKIIQTYEPIVCKELFLINSGSQFIGVYMFGNFLFRTIVSPLSVLQNFFLLVIEYPSIKYFRTMNHSNILIENMSIWTDKHVWVFFKVLMDCKKFEFIFKVEFGGVWICF